MLCYYDIMLCHYDILLRCYDMLGNYEVIFNAKHCYILKDGLRK
jgi:hypothetical protein